MTEERGKVSSVPDDADENFKEKYKVLKRKLKNLIYENEFFHQTLRTNQRKYLKATQDRNFLLERLAKYEPPELTTSDSDKTESSDDEASRKVKRFKTDNQGRGASMTPPPSTSKVNGVPRKKKKKPQPPTALPVTVVTEADMDVDTVVVENDSDLCGTEESNKESVGSSNKQCITVTPEMLSDDGSANEKMSSSELYDVVES